MVDLGDTYAIRNVTLVNTENSVDSSYLETFEITVGNTTERENHTVCVRYAPRIGRAAHQEIQCDAVQVGRYLRIAKYEERNKVRMSCRFDFHFNFFSFVFCQSV